MTPTHVHTYQCPTCKTVATSPAVYQTGRRLVCISCHGFMRYRWSDRIVSVEQLELAERGLVWNPGTSSVASKGR